jgi:hypothetical protein
MFRLEAALGAQHSGETLQHQRRSRQQHYRQGDFCNNQQIARAARGGPGSRSTGAFLQRLVQVGSRELKRRGQAEEHAGDQ